MADTSSLFGSSTPASITNSLSDMGTNLPAWLQEYTRGLAGQATAVSGEAYQPYTSPDNSATYGEDAGRIAGFTPDQQAAQAGVIANQGSYKPYTDAASQTIPQVVGQYMSPYTDSVVNRIAQLGQRNLTENLLPQVNSTFTGAGQFGSTRSSDFTDRALRDANESILGQQSSALQAGYTQAQNTAMTDLQRQAALGQQVQNQGYQDTGMLDTMGQEQQAQTQKNMDLAGTDYTAQVNYPKTQLSFLSDIIRGQPVSTTSYQANTNPAATAQQQMSPLAAAAQGFLGARTLSSPLTTATGSSSSDMRLKSNVQRIGDHPVGVGLYAYTINGHEEIGVMAQELLHVRPEAVSVDERGFYKVNYDLIN